MSDLNQHTYHAGNVVKWYENLDAITPLERSVFEANASFIANAVLLDIGIGGGRTTQYLVSKCKSYTGIDYSEGFVNVVRRKYPAADIQLMDARDLSAYKAHTFDFVNFSFNGMDYVNLSDRILILQELQRVLKPGGLFFFSTHNKSHPDYNKHPWTIGSYSAMVKLKTFLKLFPWYFRHLQYKRHEVHTEEYAIINDSAHNYSLMTFYTTPSFILEQLKEHGFGDITFYSKKEQVINPDKLDEWIFITCKKLPA